MSKVTDPTKCRSCGADVLWVRWESGKRMPVDTEPDMRPRSGGNIVLTLRGGQELGELVADTYRADKHDPKRNRYTSHFATCIHADQHRKEK